ncbi:hypothetical protein MJM28_30250, partial [Salmonella enterica subsp. enterica serovar Montevideo]|nr:hypothetical protein [Salmonella enterica subsp. enterica serovar Montevideo]
MITLKNVSKWYGHFQVLTDCSTEVKKGEVVVVCGPSFNRNRKRKKRLSFLYRTRKKIPRQLRMIRQQMTKRHLTHSGM